MNERIKELARMSGFTVDETGTFPEFAEMTRLDCFAELIVKENASEYNRLINGEAVVLPKDREHAEALVRVGMFYLENNK